MSMIHLLGHMSDRVTQNMILNGCEFQNRQASQIDPNRIALIRSAQTKGVLSLTPIMMVGNSLNATALAILQIQSQVISLATFLWLLIVYSYSAVALISWRRLSQVAWNRTSSVRAPGKIVFSSFLLAIIWGYPCLFLMDKDYPLNITYISIITAGMITGGALSLYAVPMAAAVFSCTLMLISLPAVIWGNSSLVVPLLLSLTAFFAIILISLRRQAGTFFAEIDSRITAEHNLKLTHLLFESVSTGGREEKWETDLNFTLTHSIDLINQIFSLSNKNYENNLIELLRMSNLRAKDALSATKIQNLARGGRRLTDIDLILLEDERGQTFRISGAPILDNRMLVGFQGCIKEISGELASSERLIRLMTEDHMTGLLNYREFSRQCIEKMEQTKTGLFLFIDIDNLKLVNDNLGHNAGDKLIQIIADKASQNMPEESILARKSGDEFVFFMEVEDQLEAVRFVRILASELKGSFFLNETEVQFSCSIGAAFREVSDNFEIFQGHADNALYQAKRSGRGAFIFHKSADCIVSESGSFSSVNLVLVS